MFSSASVVSNRMSGTWKPGTSGSISSGTPKTGHLGSKDLLESDRSRSGLRGTATRSRMACSLFCSSPARLTQTGAFCVATGQSTSPSSLLTSKYAPSSRAQSSSTCDTNSSCSMFSSAAVSAMLHSRLAVLVCAERGGGCGSAVIEGPVCVVRGGN